MRHLGLWMLLLLAACSRIQSQDEKKYYVYAMLFFNITTEMEKETGFSQFFISSYNDTRTQVRIDSHAINEYENLNEDNGHMKNVTRNFVLSTAVDEGVKNQGVIVVADGPVDIQATRAAPGTTDTYLSLPIVKSSREFFLPAWESQSVGMSGFGIASASGSCTELYIITNGSYERQWSMGFDRYDIYQEFVKTPGVDMTGWYINSSNPIAVFSGHECARVPTNGVNYCDHLIEQVPPVDQWGNVSIVGPIAERHDKAGYTVRVLGATDDTEIEEITSNSNVYTYGDHACDCGGVPDGDGNVEFQTCTQECLVQRGGFVQFLVEKADEALLIRCSKPCLVVQYAHSLQYAGQDVELHRPDPSMVIATPVDHYNNRFSFGTPSYSYMNEHKEFVSFISVISPTGARSGVYLDDQPVSAISGVTWQFIGDYSFCAFSITHGFHRMYHVDSDVSIMAFVYGHAQVGNDPTGYSFPATYAIYGETLKGRWEDLIEPDDPITTAVPTAKTCSRLSDADETMDQTLAWVGKAFPTQDATNVKVIECSNAIENRLPQLNATVNDLLCLGDICPMLPDNVYVKNIGASIVSLDEQLIQLDMQLTTGLDIVVKDLAVCSQQLRKYFSFWDEPDVKTKCGDTFGETFIPASESAFSNLACPVIA